MNKVFIAGGTGMLGSATARAFANRGIEVVVSSRKDKDEIGESLEKESTLIKVEKIDLLDQNQLDLLFQQHQFDGMVLLVHTHQYALTREKNNEIYPITLNCLELARKTGVKRVVMGSSVAVYGGLEPPLNESATFPPEVPDPAPADAHLMVKFEVAVKRALEIIALDYGQNFQMGTSVPSGTVKPEPHELEVAVLRAPVMFGPGYQALGSPIGIASHVAAGRLDHFKGQLAYGGMPVEKAWNGFAFVPVNYVKDNAECIAIAMLADELKHHIYNISSGFPKSPRVQFETLLKVAPDCINRMGITASDLVDNDIDPGFNSSLFEQDFGWRSPYTLESAMKDYIDWLKVHPF